MHAICARLAVVLVAFALTSGAVVRSDFRDGPLPKGTLTRLGEAGAKQEEPGRSVAFAPDGKTVAWVRVEKRKVESKIVLHVWDVAGRKEIRRCTFEAEEATATTPLVFTRDGKHLALGTYSEAGGPAKIDRDSTSKIRLWEVGTGKEVNRFAGHGGGETSDFRSLALTPDGKGVVSTSNLAVQTWDLASGRKARQFAFTGEDEGGGILYEMLSADGRILATRLNGNPVRLWDVAGGKEFARLRERRPGIPLAFTPDGKTLAVAGENVVSVFASDTGKELKWWRGKATVLTFSPKGDVAAWVGADKVIHLTEMANGRDYRTFEAEAGPLAFSPDGKVLALACADGTLLTFDATPEDK